MRMLTHVGSGGMTFAVILSAQGADEVTCASHSDAAPPLLNSGSQNHSFLTVSTARSAVSYTAAEMLGRTKEVIAI